MREMLQEIARKRKAKTGKSSLFAEDFMDDGSVLCLNVDIDEEKVFEVFLHQDQNTVVLFRRVARCLISLALALKCTATVMPPVLSHSRPSFIVCVVWLAMMFRSTKAA